MKRSLPRSLPRSLTKPRAGVGAHGSIYEGYGRSLQQNQTRSPRPSDYEIEFGSQLAEPRSRGGLVVASLQPSRGQRYTGSFEQGSKEVATLNHLDDALQMMGLSLKGISCIDAFPFHLGRMNVESAPSEMCAAYEVLLEMVRQKKPDVIICAWKAPERFGFGQYCSKCVGAVNYTEVIVVD